MQTLTYTPLHPIFFISDPSNADAEMPEVDAESVATATDTCIAVRTIADVDGDVTITLSQATPETISTSYMEIFSGELEIPSHEVAIINSHDEKLLSTVFAGTLIHVTVLVDDNVYPQKIWVEAQDRYERAPLQ